ncbi:hypothetical protein KM031_18675 (plasmid) [Gemmobacter fulvus]|uniref:MSP domain-containing protein n=1 Tax=Gemmobacter fulvus TaxID=2840474 RepID=A0A975S3X6_9RHOB|nr:hypothetical protein [Gemmobacter fulvus]MBT9246586.1 hypothetical protein [Gemmobacter fulvus]QWK92675.1 hypothetical protein KM031_18675 [Gemmobacter fulvus]
MTRFALTAITLATALILPLAVTAQTAGLLSRENRVELPPLTLASGSAVSAAPLVLKSGTYYILQIESDGSAELALEGSGFFRAVWVNEIVINDIEIRPLGIDSLEFDDEGKAEISFIAIKPGSYELRVPGSSGDSQRVGITIE